MVSFTDTRTKNNGMETKPRGRFSFAIPYVVALALFIIAPAIYFAPQFEGKVLPSSDLTQIRGMDRDIQQHREKYGEDPQWEGRMFGGMPSYLINFGKKMPVSIKKISTGFEFLGYPAGLLFVAMAAFFFMLVMFGVNPWIGIVAGLAYGFSTYFPLIISAGHVTKMVAAAYAPLLIGAVYYAYRKDVWLGGALAAFFGAVELLAQHPQITYYFLFIVAALGINELVRAIRKRTIPHFLKSTGVLVLAAGLAYGSSFVLNHYVAQYSPYSMRGGSELSAPGSMESDKGLALEYATVWSYGKTESFNLFIPDFMGGASDGGFAPDGEVAQTLAKYNARGLATQLPGYWGDQPFTGGPTYLGAAMIFLFVLGMCLLAGRNKWWVAAVSAVALMLSWGNNFMWLTELFFNYFPGYNKFRTVAMILVILQWSIPFLGALALNKLWKQEIGREELKRALVTSLYITGGVALFFLVFGGGIFNFSSPNDAQMGLPEDIVAAMRGERASMMRSDSLRSLALVLATAGVVALWGWGKLKKGWAVVLLAGLVCIDLVPVDLRFVPQSRFVEKKQEQQILPTEADMRILADTTPGFRVFNTTTSPFNDALTSYFHRSVGGYHGAKMSRYQDVIDRYLAHSDRGVLNMLNTRYIIRQGPDNKPMAVFNPGAYGAAWLADSIVWAATADEEIALLGEIDKRHTVVVDRKFETIVEQGLGAGVTRAAADSTATIEMTEYRVNLHKYSYRSPQTSIAVFSEIYYDKGWVASIDGVEVPYFRTNYILEGMILPAGDHTVEFRFAAPGFGRIYAASLGANILILLWVLAAVAIKLFKK